MIKILLEKGGNGSGRGGGHSSLVRGRVLEGVVTAVREREEYCGINEHSNKVGLRKYKKKERKKGKLENVEQKPMAI